MIDINIINKFNKFDDMKLFDHYDNTPSNLMECCCNEVRIVTKQFPVIKNRRQVMENVSTYFCKGCNKPLRVVNPNKKSKRKKKNKR